MIVATAVAGFLAASLAGAATSGTAVLRGCGTVAAAGKTWQVAAAGVPCANAKALVRKLASKVPGSGVAHVGNYMDLRCTGFAQKGKDGILCASASGKLVNAQARA
jgi:hypothetical protein